jgi:uncharacterized protein DUF6285
LICCGCFRRVSHEPENWNERDMQDEPSPEELIKAVADFLRTDIAPQISGHTAFKLRVSINALDLVTRQLKLEQDSAAAETARLSQILGTGSLGELNKLLADSIAKGELDLQTPGLAEHLWQTTMEKLAVDQPNYASYKRELGRNGG